MNKIKSLLMVSLLCTICMWKAFAQQTIVFNKVVSTTSKSSRTLNNVVNVSGTSFKFISSASTISASTSGGDVSGKLEYYNSSNVKVSISGKVAGVFENNPAKGFYFEPSTGTTYYAFAAPGFENDPLFADLADPQSNSSPPNTDLTDLYNKQSSAPASSTSLSVAVNISDPASVTESNSAYIVFTLTFSASRSTNNSISFTPTLTAVSATSNSDYSNSIEYSTSNTFTSPSTSTPISIGNTTNTLYLRVPLLNDDMPEGDETFIFKTGAFTESSGFSNLANASSGANATGTIADDGDNTYTWTGGTSTDWNTASNWNTNAVPGSSNDAKIPSGLSNYPVLGGNFSIKNLEVVSGASVSTSSSKLTLNGNLINNGSITGTGTSGKISLGGSTSQTITGTGSIDNLELSNSSGGISIATGSTQTINRGLHPVNGVLTTNDGLVMNSTATETASVFQKSSCTSDYVSGNVTIRRYIDPNSNATFRFIGNPFNSTTKTFSSFSNLPITNAYKYDNAFSTPNPNNASGDPAWSQVAGADIFTKNSGIITFVNSVPAFTIESSGPLHQCDVVVSVSGYPNGQTDRGFMLVSNPFASFLNLASNSTRSSGVKNGFYVWDTATGSGSNGSQKSRQSNFNSNGRYYSVVQNQGSGPTIVPPMGAFFVQMDGAGQVSGTITFKETEKANNNSISDYTPFSFDKNQQTSYNSTANIYYLKVLNNGVEIDDQKIVFRSEASHSFDQWDLIKFSNADFNLYSTAQGNATKLSVDTRSTEFENLEIPIFIDSKRDISNTSFELKWTYDVPLDADFVLEDQLSKDRIILSKNGVYGFVGGAKGTSSPRFKLLVRKRSTEKSPVSKDIFYPNPVVDYIYLNPMDGVEGLCQLELHNLSGKPIFTQSLELVKNKSPRIILPNLPEGLYVATLRLEDGRQFTQKLIKQ